jgi:hypothetical protein
MFLPVVPPRYATRASAPSMSRVLTRETNLQLIVPGRYSSLRWVVRSMLPGRHMSSVAAWSGCPESS